MNSCDDKQEGEKTSSKKLIKGAFLALLVGLLINTFMGLLVDFGQIVTAFKEVSLATILVPSLGIFVIYIIDTFRYQIVFSKFGIRSSFRDGLYNNIIGYFFCNVTPGSVGGQPFQVLHFSRLGMDSKVASNVVFSRLIEGNIIQLVIVAIFFHKGIGMLAGLGQGAYLLVFGMLITIVMTVVLILGFLNPHFLGVLALKMDKSWLGKLIAKLAKDACWAEKISVWSQGLGEGFKILWSKHMLTMLLDIVIAGFEQVLWSLALYIPLSVIVGAPPPYPEFLLSYEVCSLVSLFIPTPGAAGSTEASFLLVLGTLTGKPAATMSAILIWRFCTFYFHLLVGGLVYFLVPTKKAVYKLDDKGVLRHIRPPRAAGN